jgi:hypothetical protein
VLAERIQELLDEGHTRNAIATSLRIHHVQVDRIIKKNNLEKYFAFDESCDEVSEKPYEAYPNQLGEDLLDEVFKNAYDEGYAEIPGREGPASDPIKKLLSIREVGIFEYARLLGMGRLIKYVHKRCHFCGEMVSLNGYSRGVGGYLGLKAGCKKCYYKRMDKDVLRRNTKIGLQRRRSLCLHLPTLWSTEIKRRAFASFEGRCPLSDSVDTHDDHFIPLKTGHGGTVIGNMVPLLSSINMSKSDANPFAWFEANRQRFELDQSRFDSLVAKLAEQNGLTSEEFREYTDWCFANPRNPPQIKRDNERYGYRVTSVELWREATGRLRVESVS